MITPSRRAAALYRAQRAKACAFRGEAGRDVAGALALPLSFSPMDALASAGCMLHSARARWGPSWREPNVCGPQRRKCPGRWPLGHGRHHHRLFTTSTVWRTLRRRPKSGTPSRDQTRGPTFVERASVARGLRHNPTGCKTRAALTSPTLCSPPLSRSFVPLSTLHGSPPRLASPRHPHPSLARRDSMRARQGRPVAEGGGPGTRRTAPTGRTSLRG